MPLISGTRVGPYEIISLLGAGGMGEVYRARDMRLKRDVALKVLPEAWARDSERLARFQREAELLATLNHPHIAAVYGLETAGDTHAIVLELVEGRTLAETLASGSGPHASAGTSQRDSGSRPKPEAGSPKPAGSRATSLPLEDALPIARQIADALEAAHEKGIVHRDLKPANIKIAPDGQVKVLDFGLAKMLEPESGVSSLSMSPTLSLHATNAGVILGTAAYMSPEQARGKHVDRRTDIWAFGCVLFEMLAGRQTFGGGDSVSDVIAAILKNEPDWSALAADTPPHLRTLIFRCLQKDVQRRLPHIGVARIEIDEALAEAGADSVSTGPGLRTATGGSTGPDRRTAAGVARDFGPAVPPAGKVRSAVPWTVATVLGAGLATTLALWAPWRAAPPAKAVRLGVELSPETSLASDPGSALALSPDGTMLAFAGRDARTPQLYLRRLDQLKAEALPGTFGAYSPFFSPDGKWIAFFSADSKLKKIAIDGGPAVVLCDAASGRGGSWGEDGWIVFMPNQSQSGDVPLSRVSSAGGKPEPLATIADGVATERWPQVLSGGKAVLFTAGANLGASAFDTANIMVRSLPDGATKVVLRGGFYGRYLPSGHLVFIRASTLFAVPFDIDRLEPTGPPAPVVGDVTASPSTGGAQFAVSNNGTLVYWAGASSGNNVPISWIDREGKSSSLRQTSADWTGLQFSPDGGRLAMDITDGNQRDVWVYEWARDTLSRMTFDSTDDVNPVWTLDGRAIIFGSKRADKNMYNLYVQRADGTGDVQRLTESRNHQIPGSVHAQGRFLAFHEISQETGGDLMMLPVDGNDALGLKPGKPFVFLSTPFYEQVPMFSPDGRWLAYFSNESGRNEVFVRPFPGPGGKWQISTGGGSYPAWSRTRRELFYTTEDRQVMIAPYAIEGEAFRAEKPRLWSDARLSTGQYRRFDPHPDGNRIALGLVPQSQAEDKVVFVFNFFDELRRLAPAASR